MNAARLQELIAAWCDDALTPEQAAELNAMLRASAEAREIFRRESALHGLLHVAVTAAAMDAARDPLVPPAQPVRRRFWLQVQAAAAGIALGLLCATMVFAYVKPRTVTLWQESFEDETTRLAAGFPQATEVWSGDAASVVTAEQGVVPKDGLRMLRLEPAASGLWSRQFLMIDLTQVPALRDGSSRVARVTASFHAPASEIRDRYLARAAVFAEGPEQIQPEWMIGLWGSPENRALAMAAKAQTYPPGATGWQTLQLMLEVPRDSRVLVLAFWAATMHSQPERRAVHFLDDVRVTLEALSSSP